MIVKLTHTDYFAHNQIFYKEFDVKEIKGNSERLCFILSNGDYVAVESDQIIELVISN